MESMQGVKGYTDSREEEEEEEAAEIVATAAAGEESSRLHSQSQQQDAAWNSNPINHRKQQLELMELTLGSNTRPEQEELGGDLQQAGSLGVDAAAAASSSTSRRDDEAAVAVEKEHMFDKVVTPSDVGKLNRLVIPKQHAEKYFPLDSSSNEKGLLLNFEDRNGKLWRFRYSYWNSSQSYVMTKGWSRFVKEKRLDAGDIVSFHRGIGELYRHRLYIDWKPRSHHIPHPSNSLFTVPYFLPNHYSCATATAATARLYSLHSSTNNNSTIIPPPPYRDHHHFHHHLNYNDNNNFYTLHQHQYPAAEQLNSLYYLTSPTPPVPPSMSMSAGDQHFPGPGQQLQERRNIDVPMIIDSVPVAHHHRGGTGTGTLITGATTPASTTGKRLRLFGVNMECASSSASTAHAAMPNSHSLASSSLQRLSLPREDPLSSSTARFGDQRGGTSVLFDLDPSTQYQK